MGRAPFKGPQRRRRLGPGDGLMGLQERGPLARVRNVARGPVLGLLSLPPLLTASTWNILSSPK